MKITSNIPLNTIWNTHADIVETISFDDIEIKIFYIRDLFTNIPIEMARQTLNKTTGNVISEVEAL